MEQCFSFYSRLLYYIYLILLSDKALHSIVGRKTKEKDLKGEQPLCSHKKRMFQDKMYWLNSCIKILAKDGAWGFQAQIEFN